MVVTYWLGATGPAGGRCAAGPPASQRSQAHYHPVRPGERSDPGAKPPAAGRESRTYLLAPARVSPGATGRPSAGAAQSPGAPVARLPRARRPPEENSSSCEHCATPDCVTTPARALRCGGTARSAAIADTSIALHFCHWCCNRNTECPSIRGPAQESPGPRSGPTIHRWSATSSALLPAEHPRAGVGGRRRAADAPGPDPRAARVRRRCRSCLPGATMAAARISVVADTDDVAGYEAYRDHPDTPADHRRDDPADPGVPGRGATRAMTPHPGRSPEPRSGCKESFSLTAVTLRRGAERQPPRWLTDA